MKQLKAMFVGGPFDGDEHEIPLDVAHASYTVRVTGTDGLVAIYKKREYFDDGVIVFTYEREEPRRSKWLDWQPPK